MPSAFALFNEEPTAEGYRRGPLNLCLANLAANQKWNVMVHLRAI
jgi:hypothetical protein